MNYRYTALVLLIIVALLAALSSGCSSAEETQSYGITVTPASGLVTTEDGGSATFTIVLDTQPTDNVTIGLSSSALTEGIVSPTSVTFTTVNWNIPQTITVTGVNDDMVDGNTTYTIITATASSSDPNYSSLDAADVSLTNNDNDTDGTPQVTFPEDEGAHPESDVEWWYLNASLEDTQGNKYTAMVAYFTPAMRIISIADLETGTFYQDAPKFSDVFPSPTHSYAEGALDLRWDETDRWYRTDSDPLSYSLKAEGETIGLDLEIVSNKAPMMVGGDGLVEWTENSTYYYSLTRLQVDGQIEFDGKIVEVEGTGWMDHQWMEEAVPNGWDWFSFQLDDNTDIICWQIVTSDGSIQSRDMTIMFDDESIYHTVDLDIEKISSWTSPETDEAYGTTWRITETGHDLDLEVTAHFNEQEILMFTDLPEISWQFWEGGVTVSGEMDGGEVSGIGYAELVPWNEIMNMS